MKKKIIALIIMALFIGIIANPTIGSSKNNKIDKLEHGGESNWFLFDRYLTLLMKLAHKPSFSACIIIDDRVVWSQGYGLYDIENNKQATPDTLYLLASISKTVTATALMQLYDQGLFDLDDDVNDYLPFSLRNSNFPDIPITFRMLLSHRSSLASDNSDRLCLSYIPGDPDIPSYPHPWLEEYLTPDGSAYHSSVWSESPPESQYYYANIGFSIIGYLVELISGQNFNEYCEKHIFTPLGMYNTSFRLKDLDINKIAIPYFYRKGNYIPNPHYGMLVLYPAASLRTSVEQLSHFLIAHMNGGMYNDVRILNESTVELMHTEHYPLNDRGYGYGLGWSIKESKSGKKEIGHSGGWPGVHTLTKVRPDDNTAIIIFTNCYDSTQFSGPIVRLGFSLITNALFRRANRLAS
ncbi:MAG: beta-lactamase family protein [Thermoplasmatales archaeon]|nr:MAG: beta-lactamase family protein [Thermoplasmatales archaeon]